MIRLREAVSADLRQLFDLDQACFPPEIAYTLGEFRALLASRKIVRIVAEEDSFLAGFAIAQASGAPSLPGGHVITIDVASGFRRRGVGRLLMSQIEGRLTDAGAKWLRLEVAVDNHTAQEFYATLGFTATGLIRGYYLDTLDAIVMEKPLGGPAL